MKGLEELEKFLVAHTVDDIPIPDKKIAFVSEAMNPGRFLAHAMPLPSEFEHFSKQCFRISQKTRTIAPDGSTV
jgi:hypothetical protein